MRLKEINDFKLLEYLYNNDDDIKSFFNLLDVNSGDNIDLIFKLSYDNRIFNDFMLDNFIIDGKLDYKNILYLFNIKYKNNIKNLIKNITEMLDKSLLNDTHIKDYTTNRDVKNNSITDVSDNNIHIDSVQGFNSDDYVNSNKFTDDNNSNTNYKNDTNDIVKHVEKYKKNTNTLHKYKSMLSFYKDEYIINIFFKYVTNFLFNNNY